MSSERTSSSSFKTKFYGTALCVLDSGCVLIAGFSSPISGQSFLYSPISKCIKKLPKLKTPRCAISLVYHNHYVYAFGGRDDQDCDTRVAEKINIISKSSWVELPDMIKARSAASCISVGNKIYIMGGGKTSIEIYNSITNLYEISEIYLKDREVVALNIEDRIYIIGEKEYKVFDKDMELISEFINPSETKYLTWTIGNIVYYKDNIYYYNNENNLLEKVNTRNFKRKVHITSHRVSDS